jgi:osmotically-inducible protein OsmY
MRIAFPPYLLLISLVGISGAQNRDQQQATSPMSDPSRVFASAQRSDVPAMSPTSEALTTPEVEKLIEDNLTSEQALSDVRVMVKTDDNSVVLTGVVDRNEQRNVAEQIAKAYAGSRSVSNQIRVR